MFIPKTGRFVGSVCLVAALAFPLAARATAITGTHTGDNILTAFIGTDPFSGGVQVDSSNNWRTVTSFNHDLAPGVAQYLRIRIEDVGVVGGFIGEYTLSDGNFSFANGTQSLSTSNLMAPEWSVYMDGVLVEDASLVYAATGAAPWGLSGASFDGDPQWVWNGQTFNTLTFVARITPNGGVIAEPSALAILLAGLFGAAALRRGKCD